MGISDYKMAMEAIRKGVEQGGGKEFEELRKRVEEMVGFEAIGGIEEIEVL
jgi:hypothetical protein